MDGSPKMLWFGLAIPTPFFPMTIDRFIDGFSSP